MGLRADWNQEKKEFENKLFNLKKRGKRGGKE